MSPGTGDRAFESLCVFSWIIFVGNVFNIIRFVFPIAFQRRIPNCSTAKTLDATTKTKHVVENSHRKFVLDSKSHHKKRRDAPEKNTGIFTEVPRLTTSIWRKIRRNLKQCSLTETIQTIHLNILPQFLILSAKLWTEYHTWPNRDYSDYSLEYPTTVADTLCQVVHRIPYLA